jgi:hypothetical protein
VSASTTLDSTYTDIAFNDLFKISFSKSQVGDAITEFRLEESKPCMKNNIASMKFPNYAENNHYQVYDYGYWKVK